MIYLIGSIVAFILMLNEYFKTPKEERCGDSEAIGILCISALLSWIIVFIIIIDYVSKYINKFKK